MWDKICEVLFFIVYLLFDFMTESFPYEQNSKLKNNMNQYTLFMRNGLYKVIILYLKPFSKNLNFIKEKKHFNELVTNVSTTM